MCGIFLSPSFNLTQGLISPGQASDNPSQLHGTDVFRFRGGASSSSSTTRYTMNSTVKNNALDFTDNFSTSAWIKANEINRLNQYVFSFDDPNPTQWRPSSDTVEHRVYTWRLRDIPASRLTVFYKRARLDNLSPGQPDDGENSRVGLSFYIQSEIIPNGNIFDGKWHFYKLDVNYPNIKLYVDGYLHNATEGHYYKVGGGTRDIERLNRNGSFYSMPARIIAKDDSYKNRVNGYIGGTQQHENYNFDGDLRLLFMTSTMDNSQYTCITSCNNSLIPQGYTPSPNEFTAIIGNFSVFYQPVSRTLYFNNSNAPPSEYTAFMQTFKYNSNGYLPAQTVADMGEGRRLEFRVSL